MTVQEIMSEVSKLDAMEKWLMGKHLFVDHDTDSELDNDMSKAICNLIEQKKRRFLNLNVEMEQGL